MYITLPKLVEKYGLAGKIKGIIHVGAHTGEEAEAYQECGVKKVVWVEPCQPALAALHMKIVQDGNSIILGCAFGERIETDVMRVAPANTGMSNSLLSPHLHMTQFPDIVFNQTEVVMVFPMDTFAFLQVGRYNFLNMDVQGFEDRVLRGGKRTLQHIDYVYTEVNRAEVYRDCAKIEELDKMLHEFERVETFWCDGGQQGDWGDAFYIRKTAR